MIDGAIGELSFFHDEFGYYAQGVGPTTAVLPAGWEGRFVKVENENTRGAIGLCLEIHDLLAAKSSPVGRRTGVSRAMRFGWVSPIVRLCSRASMRYRWTPLDERGFGATSEWTPRAEPIGPRASADANARRATGGAGRSGWRGVVGSR